MKPYSDEIIFFDTEFTYLDPKIGSLLSIGMVKNTGEELYLELAYDGTVHPWVKKHVLPSLTGEKVDQKTARRMLRKFMGKEEPYLMAYVNQFDAIYWYDLFGSPQKHPAYWIPMDFASILFGHGFDPNSMGKKKFFTMLGIDKEQYVLHNALDDARLLRDVYHRFIAYIEKE
ncbi:MAG TPA: hypothetical protein VEA18_02335 [Candidatus Kapabacteria bacterium]|nr:hypothetical protein [Candidatus Kapabacteria bacterium]